MEEIGQKFDQDKIMPALVDPNFIEDIAKVLTFGAKKYEKNSWQFVRNAEERYKNALLRHILAYLKSEKIDKESGLSHLSHAGANIMFLRHFEEKYNEKRS